MISSPASAALPSKRPRHMTSEDELKPSTDSQSYIKVTICSSFRMVMWIDHLQEPQTIVDNSGEQSWATPDSLDDESRSNASLPSSSPSNRSSQSDGSRRSRSKRNRSQIIIDHDENVSLDPDSGVDGPSLSIDFDGDGSNEDGEHRHGSDQLLWNGVLRRQVCRSSVAHKNVLTMTKPYLLAMIYGGPAGSENTAWLGNRKPWLENRMKRAWKTMATHIGRAAGTSDHDVAAEPTPEEARHVG